MPLERIGSRVAWQGKTREGDRKSRKKRGKNENNALSSDNEGSQNARNNEQEAKMTLSLPVTASLYSTPTKPQRSEEI